MKTFNEWKELGYHVIKGNKSTKRNADGIPLFSQDQVAKTKVNPSYSMFGAGWYMEPHPNAGMRLADSGFDIDSIAGHEFEAHRNDPELDNLE